MDTGNKLRDFILTEMQWKGTPEQLTMEYALIDNGVVDSLGLFMLVTFIEDQFGFQFELEELRPENFSSIEAMTRLIERKRAAGNGAAAAGA